MTLAHAPGSAEFFWAIAAEASLLVWTGLLFSTLRGRAEARWRFPLVGLAAALAASLITLAGKTLEVWPGNPLFPSGHTAYVVTIAVLLVARDRRWLLAAVPLLALMAVALVLANYHVVTDVVGGAAVGLAVGAVSARWARARTGPGLEGDVGAASIGPSR